MMAGNEIRVVADYEKVDEGGISLLADDIASSIEASLNYPGEVMVTVIREARVTEIAR
jgi:ribonuclease Y